MVRMGGRSTSTRMPMTTRSRAPSTRRSRQKSFRASIRGMHMTSPSNGWRRCVRRCAPPDGSSPLGAWSRSTSGPITSRPRRVPPTVTIRRPDEGNAGASRPYSASMSAPGPVQFIFGLHVHQPVGNFDRVFEEHARDVYLPFLSRLRERDCLPVMLHISGPLLEWMEAHGSPYLDLVGRLVADGQIELLLSGMY